MQNTKASLRKLEVHMDQLATKVTEIDQRTTNTLSSTRIPNSIEECKAIALISDQVASVEAKVTEMPVEKKALEEVQNKEEHAPSRHPDNPFSVDLEKYPVLPKALEYKPKMPYPQRLQKETKDKQF
ncbi:hypothetical protein AHAS_Ahas11G0207400 [Arachis hypogaea]